VKRHVLPSHPWHLRNGAALEAFVDSLPLEACEWLLALYVDDRLNLLSVETVGAGRMDTVPLDFGHVIHRGRAQGAASFILVHNHPSGDPTPSAEDIKQTARLAWLSKECGVPLIGHYVIAEHGAQLVGHW